jgi:hypothetical protein
MQHCTKVPLLLNNIRRYTEEQREQNMLTVSLQKLETSLREYSLVKHERLLWQWRESIVFFQNRQESLMEKQINQT